MLIRTRLVRMGRAKLIGIGSVIFIVAAVLGVGIWTFVWAQRNVPDTYANINQHFRYGSFGGEATMPPYWIWRVLPTVLLEYLPYAPGEGYERFGFIYDDNTPTDHPRPIGISYREAPIPLMGFNCAACHTGTLRESPDAPRWIISGMPANRVNIWEFTLFLFPYPRH